ncbi:carboxylating nicotinate-nucleotide diphosphorylase [Haloplasma contractile]|uniref:Probable nicotinate-nucleotide pyrophosphorylase [carboxylating] n=1 Tax=Haloplasma contractile SSD-17B TaxID=1033810 RepID=U2DZT7_9MOLU|nr:carboxylating nicotinate-nucleotide diphosphorylase [Haloplasma contractile]ERJ13702.1 Quinolinate phosphoribosyltransferase decarboxylating protein [Haloplasma contractile SSD-17B]
MKELVIKELIKNAILEDMPYGDVTTDHLLSDDHKSKGHFIAKESGIVAGIQIAKQVFEYIDPSLKFEVFVNDGEQVLSKTIIAELEGRTKSILKSERLALNIMQRMSGIATLTHKFVSKVEGTGVRIVDTRKTTPNFRILEKEAVIWGGGYNHRFNLSDAVMIKDNHIVAAGGITQAIETIKLRIPHTTKIEIEVEDLLQLEEAIEAGADIIMLDNMTNEKMAEAVKINNNRAILEASGNMNLERIESVAKTGVDVISVGALTHSYQSLDISLRFKI